MGKASTFFIGASPALGSTHEIRHGIVENNILVTMFGDSGHLDSHVNRRAFCKAYEADRLVPCDTLTACLEQDIVPLLIQAFLCFLLHTTVLCKSLVSLGGGGGVGGEQGCIAWMLMQLVPVSIISPLMHVVGVMGSMQ